jgi:hypothetical protein
MPRPVRGVVIILGAWLVASELHGAGVRWAPVGPEKWLHLVMMATARRSVPRARSDSPA